MYFSLLYLPRTGSHFLRTCLQSHTQIDTVVHEGITGPIIDSGRDLWPETDATIGKKLSSSKLRNLGRLSIVREPAIVTYRNNKLAQYISLQLAERDHRWTSKAGNYIDSPIKIDIDHAIKMIRYWDRIEERVRMVVNALWLEYGELVGGDGLIRAQQHLGLPVETLRRTLTKQSRGANISYVSNLDEILRSPLAGWV